MVYSLAASTHKEVVILVQVVGGVELNGLLVGGE